MVSISRGQDPAGGAATGSLAGNGSRGAPGQKPAVAIPVKVLQRYVGTYVGPGGRENAITLDGNQLMAQLDGQPQVAIYRESETKFFLRVVQAEVEFITNRKGIVTALTIHQEGGSELTMTREGDFVPSDNAQVQAEVGMLSARAAQWLVQWDAGNWPDCWNGLTPQARGKTPLESWGQNAIKAHDLFGKLVERKITAVAGPHRSDGEPSGAGDVGTVTFAASFEKAGPCFENIRLAKQPDGTWAIVGHMVRPKAPAAQAKRIGSPRPIPPSGTAKRRCVSSAPTSASITSIPASSRLGAIPPAGTWPRC